MKQLLERCCEYLKQGNSREIYREVLPFLKKYETSDLEVPVEIQSLMTSCILLDAYNSEATLNKCNIVKIVK